MEKKLGNKVEYKNLVAKAFEAQRMSYSPYSNFKVGAALLGKSSKVYLGCNIENSSYGATNCAERTAFFKAVSEGETEFEAIAIVGGDNGELCAPCGICRQVMAEFCRASKFVVILGKSEEEYKVFTLEELLPMSFGKANLQ